MSLGFLRNLLGNRAQVTGLASRNEAQACRENTIVVDLTPSDPFTPLKLWEQIELKAGRCPDCKGDKFREGASGGVSTNYECLCGSRFNIGPSPEMSERISKPMEFARGRA